MSTPEDHTYEGDAVKAWSRSVSIPTYPAGSPDPNPMFLEKRVYQGSSGAVYPYKMIHTVSDEKSDCSYQAVFLENRYLKIMILPELGGRVQMALDKTNDYHFVYYNRVIKPALVGLAGPWIAGGIEFNWPQHHRPTTFSPAEFEIRESEDGSITVWVGEWEPMYRTRSAAGFRLYPERAVLEINGRLSNPTPLAQTFLWWANPAVPVNENYQSVFPPDVTAVFDHGKRDLTRFPVATGSYYKVDYSRGVDISWYKNVPVPTSYMAYHSDYNFLGGYDHGRRAGVLHVSDHHVSPGKKMWSWGTADFGRAWERNLTDEDGPYVELMTGVFTDNQPDFSWLESGEEKRFVQYFLPFKGAAPVRAASERVVLGVRDEDDCTIVILYGSEELEVKVSVELDGDIAAENRFQLEPAAAREWRISGGGEDDRRIYRVYDGEGRLLVRYPLDSPGEAPRPEKARSAPKPETAAGNEELFLWGRHVEQYRHATFSPEPYYLEALKRDPGDSRVNNAMGLRCLKRAEFSEAEAYFRTACGRLQGRNPNPAEGEPLFNLALALWYQGRNDEAFKWFYKSTWNQAAKARGFFFLARIAASRGELERALGFIEAALDENALNLPAVHLRSVLLRRLRRTEEAQAALDESLVRFPVNHLATAEGLLSGSKDSGSSESSEGSGSSGASAGEWPRSLLTKPHLLLEILFAYGHAGFIDDALALIDRYLEEAASTPREAAASSPQRFLDGGYPEPLILYLKAFYHHRRGESREARDALRRAEESPAGGAFPNQLEMAAVLAAVGEMPEPAPMAAYQLGSFCYAHGAFERAHKMWRRCTEAKPDFQTAHRNLALSFFNKKNDSAAAVAAMDRAFQCGSADAQILLELDVLSSRIGRKPARRLELLESHLETVFMRDDLTITYVTLLNLTGRHQDARRILGERHFHPWEGGEGKVPEQYKRCLIETAKVHLETEDYRAAAEKLTAAKHYPENLGEGKLPTAEADNEINFWLACALGALGDEDAARKALEAASAGDETPEISFYYNDRPADAIFFQALAWRLLGRENRARRLLYRLRDYAEDHLSDHIEIDYFAVSLPDVLMFEENLDNRNEQFCRCLLALGEWGMGRPEIALRELNRVIESDPAHPGAVYTLPLIRRAAQGGKSEHVNRFLKDAFSPQGRRASPGIQE